MRRIFSRYLVLVGLLVNLFVAAFVIYWVSIKFAGTDLYRDGRRFVYGSLDGVGVAFVAPVGTGTINHSLKVLPAGAWFKIHEQVGDSEEVFSRQVHGGAAFDPVRGRLMLFGSDTHSLNWDNSVRVFDMGTLRWSSAYAGRRPRNLSCQRRRLSRGWHRQVSDPGPCIRLMRWNLIPFRIA